MLGYRYRLRPTTDQAEALAQWSGCARAVYNAALEQRHLAYRQGVTLRYNDQGAGLGDLKAALPWLAEPHSDVIQQALRDLDRAYTNFFAGRARFPRYRARRRGDSFRIQNRKTGRIEVRRLNRRWGEVRVPKLGWVRFRWTRKPVGDVRHLTITRDASGWHVSLCCADQHGATTVHPGTPVGVDRGVTNTVALSTGEMRHCPGLPAGQTRRLRRLARKAGRQETARRHRPNDQRRRSTQHQRTLDHIARLRGREARIRNDFLHKLSTDLAKNHSVIAIEALRVTSMTRSAKGTTTQPGRNVRQKAGLNRSILAQGWGILAQHLAYKTARFGGIVVRIPATYTSQTCAECGTIDAASRHRERFDCVACGHVAHADVNAARNILAAGLVVTARGALGEVNQATNREPLKGLSQAA